jgi:DNA ligase (NAD+)
VQVKAPVLDDDGFQVLLDEGPDAARAVATIGDGSEPAADAVAAPIADDAGRPAPDPAAAVDADGAEPAGD